MLKSISFVFLLPFFAFASPNRGADLISNAPLRFEANRGQWPADVRFATRSAERGMVLGAAGEARVGPLTVRPIEANPKARSEGLDRLSSGATYLLGQDRKAWRGNVPSFSAVAYRELYPGVDLIYKGTGRRVEYDFIVAPRADAGAIRLEFAGADALSIAADGSLVASVGGQEQLRQPLPFAFQEDAAAAGTRTQVAARYKLLGGNRAAFELGDYDSARALTIDPVMVATYFGGDSIDVATAVAVDSQNQVWVAGYTSSANLPLAGTPYLAERIGNVDIFVAKFNPNVSGGDSLVWTTYFGGDGPDKVTAMALSTDGFVYLTGNTLSTNFPLAGTPAQGAIKGDTDAFLVKFSRTQQGTDALWYSKLPRRRWQRLRHGGDRRRAEPTLHRRLLDR